MKIIFSIPKNKFTFFLMYTVIILGIISFIFLNRKDSFYDFIVNIDESLWFYNLKSLDNGFLPFIDFDTTTSGPFSIFLLKLFYNFDQTGLGALRFNTLLGLILIIFLFVCIISRYINYHYVFITFICFLSFLSIKNNEFFAYNTEWLLNPFLFILYFLYLKMEENKYDIGTLITFIFILFILPLIKFQFVLFSCFYFILVLIKLATKNKLQLKVYLLLSIIWFFLFFFSFNFTVGIRNFYEYYISRNLDYSNFYHRFKFFDKFAVYSNKYIFLEFINKFLTIFLSHILLILLLLLSFKRVGYRYIYVWCLKYKVEILFFLISILTVYIPKNNFDHYFQILFVPFSILMSKMLINKSVKSGVLTIVFFFLFINANSLSNDINIFFYKKTNKKFERIMNKKESNQVYNYSMNSVMQNYSFLNDIKFILLNRNKNNKVYFLGWHKAAVSYYKFRDIIKQTSAVNNSNFLLFSKNIKSKSFYNLELKNHYKVLFSKPEVIIDFDKVLENLNDNFTNKFILNYYNLIDSNKNFIYYKLKDFK
jgi:hypothetical protein